MRPNKIVPMMPTKKRPRLWPGTSLALRQDSSVHLLYYNKVWRASYTWNIVTKRHFSKSTEKLTNLLIFVVYLSNCRLGFLHICSSAGINIVTVIQTTTFLVLDTCQKRQHIDIVRQYWWWNGDPQSTIIRSYLHLNGYRRSVRETWSQDGPKTLME